MRGYFYTLLVCSVCGAVCTLLAWGGFEKYIKYISSLVCAVILISPLASLLGRDNVELNPELTQSDASIPIRTHELAEKQAEEYINEMLFNEFGIKEASADIKIDWGQDGAVLLGISVALSGQDLSRADEICIYLREQLGSEVTVIEA